MYLLIAAKLESNKDIAAKEIPIIHKENLSDKSKTYFTVSLVSVLFFLENLRSDTHGVSNIL